MRGSNNVEWTDYATTAHMMVMGPYGDGIWIGFYISGYSIYQLVRFVRINPCDAKYVRVYM